MIDEVTVRAFSHLEHVTLGHSERDCNHVATVGGDEFPMHRLDLTPGCYNITATTKRFEFSPGTEGCIKYFSDDLAGLVYGYECGEEVLHNVHTLKQFRFIPIISSPEFGGSIGPAVCAILARDFTEFEKDARRFSRFHENGEKWLQLYQSFTRAFVLGAERGLVEVTTACSLRLDFWWRGKAFWLGPKPEADCW